MKNLKKVLALALAFAMSLTLFAGAAFTDDASIGVDYKDDVNMLVQLGVVGGYADGSFKPQGNITRAETTKLIYVLKYGYDDSGKLFAGSASKFTDVQNNANVSWAKGYINYCYNQGIVGGVGNNKFNPNGNVTVAELAKMLLVCLGADAIKEGYGGPNWASNVTADAMELGVFDGWTGDPTQPATRELACKLMRNTIFAPMYLYNAITGIGSQVNALDGKTKNETLGEKTMGLKHVSGLVVSNPRYQLPVDEEGLEVKGEVNGYNTLNNVKGKSQIYYEVTGATGDYTDNNGKMALLTIEEDLSDDLIGNKVEVYFKTTDNTTTSGVYKKVELLGEVLVSADTVAYDVMSSDIEIMPNGKSTSEREIKPYISFTTEDGEEKQVYGRIDYKDGKEADEVNNSNIRVANNYNAGKGGYEGYAFAPRMFSSSVNSSNYESVGALTCAASYTDKAVTGIAAPFNTMGDNELVKYRFISVDGGDTFSYILNMGDVKKAKVSTLTDSTISISGMGGTKELGEEAEIVGEVTKGQDVIAYYKNGKVFVEPTEIITGKASNFKDHTATINSKIYVAAVSLLGEEIDNYFISDSGKNNDNTQYTVYKNYILDIDAVSVAGAATDYAVILYSEYDEKTGVAKAKFAFADNTEATYEIGRVASKETDNDNLMAAFEDNGMVGALVRVSVNNGIANLTGNNVNDLYAKVGEVQTEGKSTPDKADDKFVDKSVQVVDGTVINDDPATKRVDLVEGKFTVWTKAGTETGKLNWVGKTYATNANSIIFTIWGGEKNDTTGKYSSLKAKAYKVDGLRDNQAEATRVGGTDGSDMWIADAVNQVTSNGMNALVAGVMSVGTDPVSYISDEDSIAYLLSAKDNYNTETNKWYIDVNMITAEGLVSTRTTEDVSVEGVTNYTGSSVGADAMTPGSLVIYEMTAAEDGSDAEWINSIEYNTVDDDAWGERENMVKKGAALKAGTPIADGYYAVQIAVVDEEMIGFFANSNEQLEAADKESWADDMITMDINPYKYATIAIDDVNFVEGGDVETIGYSDVFAKGSYNAIIVVEDDEIIRVFSLYDNLKAVK